MVLITRQIIEMLYIRFASIWGDRFTYFHKNNPGMLEIWYEEWMEGLQGIDPNCFRDAIKYCRQNLEWSPSIAEFIRICDRALKIPNPKECIESALRGDFHHPIIEKIYNKIGSWDFKQMTSEKLLSLVTEIHNEEMIEFRKNRSLAGQQMKLIGEKSHGSGLSNHHTGGNNLPKAQGYLF